MLHIKFTASPFDRIESGCMVINLFSDQRPLKGVPSLVDWRLNGRLSRVLISNRFEGKLNESLLLPSEGRVKAKDLLVIGLGLKSQFSEASIGSSLTQMLKKLEQMKTKDFVISFSDIIPDRFEWRNAVRLLGSKLHDFPGVEMVNLCENEEYIKDAKRRHMDFGMNVDVSFEMLNL